MSNQNQDVTFYHTVGIPEITPLPMGAPVKFFAPIIDVAIQRGIIRLKHHIQINPKSEEWISFGWMDGGLSSPFVGSVIGAFRKRCEMVDYAPAREQYFQPEFSIQFSWDWERIADLAKETLIQGYDISYQEKKVELLKNVKALNINPEM
ncbi:hypothetical protein [Microbulbifer epialgicus]|uniref:Uncharacterized protein n=1 Tax=Microbulbifer epialgicus TaxID=393907 RepID=A0ABV4NUW7_9GAMM